MRKHLLIASAIVLLVGAAPPPVLTFPVELTVPAPPTSFQREGKQQLVYELLVRSLRAGDLDWMRLEVLDDRNNTLATYSGSELADLVTRPGSNNPDNPTHIPAGTSALAYLWIPLAGEPPARIHHRAVFVIPASSRHDERVVEGASVPVTPKPLVLGPPVHGEAWVARWNSNNFFHRRASLTIDGR